MLFRSPPRHVDPAIRAARDLLGEAMDAALARGDLAPEKIEAAIRDHRARHPYGR